MTYVGYASTESGTGDLTFTYTAAPLSSAQAGDLVLVEIVHSTSTTITNTVSGGQTWTAYTKLTGSSSEYASCFSCIFNGTWTTSPAFSHSDDTWGRIHVLHPQTGYLWAIDTALSGSNFAAPSAPYDVTRTGITTTYPSFVLAGWTSSGNADVNAWTWQSGAGWTGNAYYNSAHNIWQAGIDGYMLQANAGATGDPVARLSKSLDGMTWIWAWYEYLPSVTVGGTLDGTDETNIDDGSRTITLAISGSKLLP